MNAQPVSVASLVPPTINPADLDGLLHAIGAKGLGGLSPIAPSLAFLDWAVHMANAPYRRLELAGLAFRQGTRLAGAANGGVAIASPPNDHRFADPSWTRLPSMGSRRFTPVEDAPGAIVLEH